MNDRGRHEKEEPVVVVDMNPEGSAEHGRGYHVLRDDAIGPPSNVLDLRDAVRYAVETDTVLTPQTIQETWNDAFLTNVMIPVLRHIVGNMERQLEDLEDEMLPDSLSDMTLSPFNNQVYDRLSAQIIALSKVILILQEWRG